MNKRFGILLCLVLLLGIITMIAGNNLGIENNSTDPVEPNGWPQPDLSDHPIKPNGWPQPDLSMNPVTSNIC